MTVLTSPFPLRAGAAVTMVAAAAMLASPTLARAQSVAPAVAITSTPTGALPSAGAGALGSSRLSLGFRYGRLSDRYIEPADEESVEGLETYERDMYAAEVAVGIFGGSLRAQVGRSHARYRYERADTVVVGTPMGMVAGAGFSRQLMTFGLSPMRVGIGTDISGGWADLGGETAMSAIAQLPVSLRMNASSTALVLWAAPALSWGSLREETGTISTASAGLRVELPIGTSIDLAGTQLMGDHAAVWGGNRMRFSLGVSHAIGGGHSSAPEPREPSYRPRYSTAAPAESDPKTVATAAPPAQSPAQAQPAAQPDTQPAARERRARPATMPAETAAKPAAPATQPVAERATVASAAPPPARQEPAAAPAQAAAQPARQAAAAPAQPAPRPAAVAAPANPAAGRSIFYQEEAARQPAPPAAVPAEPAVASAAPSRPAAAPAQPAATRPQPATRSSAPPAATRFTVQAGAVKTNAEAEQLRDSLAAAGFTARVISGDDYFRIRIGRFTTRNAAEALATRLRSAQFEAWVTTAEQ